MADTRRTILNAGPMFARPLPPSGGGARSHTLVVASTSSLPTSQGDADLVVDAAADAAPALNAALAARAASLSTGLGIRFLEGRYLFRSSVTLPAVSGASVSGLGMGVTQFDFDLPRTPWGGWPDDVTTVGLFTIPAEHPYFAHFSGFDAIVLPHGVATPAQRAVLIYGPHVHQHTEVDVDRCALAAPGDDAAISLEPPVPVGT